MLRFLTAGESHGPALVVVVEGLPAGLPITLDAVGDELARRRLGFGRGPRMRFERDDVEFLGGVRHGTTLGSPVSIVIHNTEWPKWEPVMAADPVQAKNRLEFIQRVTPMLPPNAALALVEETAKELGIRNFDKIVSMARQQMMAMGMMPMGMPPAAGNAGPGPMGSPGNPLQNPGSPENTLMPQVIRAATNARNE